MNTIDSGGTSRKITPTTNNDTQQRQAVKTADKPEQVSASPASVTRRHETTFAADYRRTEIAVRYYRQNGPGSNTSFADAQREIDALPRPDREDPAEIRNYNTQRADIAQNALDNSQPPSRSDFNGLPPRLADMEYRDALNSYNASKTEFEGYTAERNSSTPPPINADELIEQYGGIDDISEEDAQNIGGDIAEISRSDPERAAELGNEVLTLLAGKDRGDDVASGFSEALSNEELRRFGLTASGRSFLNNAIADLGAEADTSVSGRERSELERLQRAVSGEIDEAAVQDVVDRTLHFGTDVLTYALSSSDYTDPEKNEIIQRLVQSGPEGLDVLTRYQSQIPRNITYDSQRIVADAVGNAYQAGAITDADFANLIRDADPETVSNLVLTLATDPDNTTNGLLGGLGVQAQNLGFQDAADIAFTSSDALMDRYLPTEADRDRAFTAVRSRIEALDEESERQGLHGEIWAARSDVSLLVGNAARLTAAGDGYSTTEFDALLQRLGPDVVNEAIARSTNVPGDQSPDGALGVLAEASQRIAEGAEGEDQTKWELNYYTAATQSESLINHYLNSPLEREQAFDALNRELVRTREDVDMALDTGFTLLSQPAEANGITRLLETHGTEILDAKLGNAGDNYEGMADVVQFLQSTLYSPITDPALADRIKNVLGNYIDHTFGTAQSGDLGAGERIGALMGIHDVAFQRAYEAASEPSQRSALDQLGVDVTKFLLGKGAAALLAPTGPIGSAAGGFVTDQVLSFIFKDRSPSAAELGEEFLNLLESEGVEIDSASNYRDGMNEVIRLMIEGIHSRIGTLDPGSAEYQQLQNAETALTRIQSNFRDRALEIEDEYEDVNGKLREALNDW